MIISPALNCLLGFMLGQGFSGYPQIVLSYQHIHAKEVTFLGLVS